MTNEADIEAMADLRQEMTLERFLYEHSPQAEHLLREYQRKCKPAASPANKELEWLKVELEVAQANYSGAMADLDALVDAFYIACPDNYFLNANYPREGSDKIVACRDKALAEIDRLRECLLYAKRFLKPEDVDMEYIEQALEGAKS